MSCIKYREQSASIRHEYAQDISHGQILRLCRWADANQEELPARAGGAKNSA